MPRLDDLARLERDRALELERARLLEAERLRAEMERLELERLAMERTLEESYDYYRDSYDSGGYGWDN